VDSWEHAVLKTELWAEFCFWTKSLIKLERLNEHHEVQRAFGVPT
jgi:hypothetical protein